jgi:hypothetical protein
MSTARKTAKRVSKSKITKSATKPSSTARAPEHSFGGHKEGSRKSKVHRLCDEQGAEAAWVLGLKLKLKEGTLRSWFAAWKRPQSNSENKAETNAGTPPAIEPDGLSATSEAAYSGAS